MNQIFEKLDFNKIKERIKRFSTSELGKERIDSIYFEVDVNKIGYNLEVLSEFKSLIEADEIFPIDGIKDIRESLARCLIENSFLQTKEFLDLLSTIKISRVIKIYFSRRKEKYPLLYKLTENLFFDKILEFNIEKTINENGEVKDNASKNLKEIRQRIISLTSQLTKEIDRILKKLSVEQFTQEDLITQRDGRFVIPIKVEHKRHVPGFIHSSSASGATVFIEPTETLELNNELRSMQFEEQREIERILKSLTDLVRQKVSILRNTIITLGEIDFLYAKAQYSIEIIASKPFINQNGIIKIKDGLHPVLLQKHKRSEVVPLNFKIGGNFNTIIITGPNAGGKSVTLKTIGIFVLMLQCGLLIPASPDSEFKIFKNLFVDIGDEQSIENDLSTFSSHLLHLKEITENANEDSLVLIDEIGEGTDPIEGGAIAAAVLKILSKKNAFTVATTHQGSLKIFAYQSEGIENGAMEFNQKTFAPTYCYREGIPGSSYALEIASTLGLQKKIIELAKELIGEDKNKLEKIIGELEDKLQYYTEELKSITREREELKKLIKINQEESKELKKEKNRVKSIALKEAESIINRMNSKIENAIKEIREKNAERDIIIKSKTILEEVKDEYGRLKNEFSKSDHFAAFEKGQKIKLKNGNEIGEIVDLDPEKHKVVVNFKNLYMDVPIQEIELVDISETGNFDNLLRSSSVLEQKKIKRELDLRGKYSVEAIPLIDKFLDEAFLQGLERVDIIHGHGTGALRKKVTDYLRNHEYVKSFRLGELNEGGAGVTIVELI